MDHDGTCDCPACARIDAEVERILDHCTRRLNQGADATEILTALVEAWVAMVRIKEQPTSRRMH